MQDEGDGVRGGSGGGGRFLGPLGREDTNGVAGGGGGGGVIRDGPSHRQQPQPADLQDRAARGVDDVEVHRAVRGAVLGQVQQHPCGAGHFAGPGQPVDGGGHAWAAGLGEGAGRLQRGVEPADPPGARVRARGRGQRGGGPAARAPCVADDAVGGAHLDAQAGQRRGEIHGGGAVELPLPRRQDRRRLGLAERRRGRRRGPGG
ncbi:hypothetical protein GCM10020000_75510 [Streptomyces olivoverticillatus]